MVSLPVELCLPRNQSLVQKGIPVVNASPERRRIEQGPLSSRPGRRVGRLAVLRSSADGQAALTDRWPVARLMLAWLVGGVLLAPATAAAAAVGSVFVSYSADGVPSYASQRLDASYRLFIRGEAPVEERSKAAKKPLSDSRQPGRRQLTPLIEHYARVHQVTPELVAAVIGVESGFNPRAVSRKGALGAMQLMPATAARYGVTNAADPAQNIDAGVRHLKDLLNEHQGNVALALAAYNAGQGAVARHGGRIPPYRETMLYVPAVLAAAARGNRQ